MNFQDKHYIIIDEMSMIGQRMFAWVDKSHVAGLRHHYNHRNIILSSSVGRGFIFIEFLFIVANGECHSFKNHTCFYCEPVVQLLVFTSLLLVEGSESTC